MVRDHSDKIWITWITHGSGLLCSGSVVVAAYDFESARPGSNPECGSI